MADMEKAINEHFEMKKQAAEAAKEEQRRAQDATAAYEKEFASKVETIVLPAFRSMAQILQKNGKFTFMPDSRVKIPETKAILFVSPTVINVINNRVASSSTPSSLEVSRGAFGKITIQRAVNGRPVSTIIDIERADKEYIESELISFVKEAL
jgi:hypothetical protein